MPEDPVKIVLGLIGIFFISILGIIIVSYTSNVLSGQQCQVYQDTINQKDIVIGGLNSSLQETARLLDQCNANYNKLVTENITKQDFVEIKGYQNLTHIQISNLNQKFDQISESYISIYNSITNKYVLSIGINIALGIEILSFFLFKNELLVSIMTWVRKKKSQKTEIHQSVHINNH